MTYLDIKPNKGLFIALPLAVPAGIIDRFADISLGSFTVKVRPNTMGVATKKSQNIDYLCNEIPRNFLVVR